MQLTIPIYVEEHRVKNQPSYYTARPLMKDFPVVNHQQSRRAVAELAKQLRKTLLNLMADEEHGDLAEWTFAPDFREHRYDMRLDLRQHMAKCTFLVADFRWMGRRMAFTPSLPDQWFEVPAGQDLRERATEVLCSFFREKEKEDPEEWKPENFALHGHAWTTALEIDVPESDRRRGARAEHSDNRFVVIGGEGSRSGASELNDVGECLDMLYPEGLSRAVLRDDLVESLFRVLSGPVRRPVLIVGPRKAGKTALVHECVYRRAKAGREGRRRDQKVWHLSPQRLISGMSFVGQWEARLIAIMTEAKRRDHVLYFDDLLGLYLAGVCGSSDLSVAQVIKPHIERSAFRLLAEITPEGLRVLQEKDRGFVDCFHIIRVPEATENETRRIAISVIRTVEDTHGSSFGIDALPTVMELQRRYVHDTAFPGKVVDFCRQLAMKFEKKKITRDQVLQEFQTVSGLSVSFLDGRKRLPRQEIEEGLEQNIVGQPMAVKALADSICRAKARLNDPDRPLGAFLFLGPTGVGKTQCAKAAAAYLFGDEKRMVRIDLNEFNASGSAARLVGTFEHPEGLLTSEVRRQPFGVLLLDEVEKADPDVFDVLLQVLGEGRLSDAMGRTTDFTNMIVIMTSNLGAREANARLGFDAGAVSNAGVYTDAAERFFRPEFFNRLDAVIPFGALSRKEIETIAQRLLQEVLQRHGLRQRRCVIEIDASAMERMVAAGYDPQLGARALKRVVESRLAQPIARQLSAHPPGAPTVLSVYAAGGEVEVSAQCLNNAERMPRPEVFDEAPDVVLERVGRALRRLQARMDAIRPKEKMIAGGIHPAHELYLAATEQANKVRILYRKLSDRLARPAVKTKRVAPAWRARHRWSDGWGPASLRNLLAERDLRDVLSEARDGEKPDEQLAGLTKDLILEAGLLNELVEAESEPDANRALVVCLATDGARGESRQVLERLHKAAFESIWGFTVAAVDGAGCEKNRRRNRDTGGANLATGGWTVEGRGAGNLAQGETGTHLFISSREIAAVMVRVKRLKESDDALTVMREMSGDRDRWLRNLESGDVDASADPFRFGPVVRVYESPGMMLDVRTGIAGEGKEFHPGTVRRAVLSRLPLPQELEG